MTRFTRYLLTLVVSLLAGMASFAETYGPWGDGDSVKNPDKLGPTYLMSMPLTIDGSAAVQGDCVAVYRQDTSALCGLGKVLDGTGKLTLVCYAPQDTTLHFKVWVAASGTETPNILDCRSSCDLAAPAPGSFYTGHSLTAVSESPSETKVATPVVTPVDGTTFVESCTIEIVCATDGASIYYTTNGNTPKLTSKYLYSAPITVYDSVNIKAVAVKDGLDNSDTVQAAITKLAMTLENAISATDDMTVSTGGDKDWAPVKISPMSAGGLSAKSGLFGDDDDGCESWLSVSVNGAGTLEYWAMTSCEHDYDGTCTWDHLEVYVDGVEQSALRMDGSTCWTLKSIEFPKSGSHVVKWRYVKDDSDYVDEDCAWISCVSWTPSSSPDELLPELVNPTSADVKAVLDKAQDPGLSVNITNGTAYAAFRTWAYSVKAVAGDVAAGAAGVMASSNAWISYALGCDALIGTSPTDTDLEIEDFVATSTKGMFDFEVSIKDVTVGSSATAANLSQIIGVIGATTLNTNIFSAANVNVTFGTPTDGKVKFSAGPKDADAKTFFMKVKMLP